MNGKSEWCLVATDLVLGLVVELVGQPGEVVADLLAHGDLYLLALPAPGPRHAHALRPRRVQEEDSSQEQQHCRPHGRGCRCHCVAPSSSWSAVALVPASHQQLCAHWRLVSAVCLGLVLCVRNNSINASAQTQTLPQKGISLQLLFCFILDALGLRFFSIHQSVRWRADADATVSFV